ncbi:hypothetical protein B0H16DRAFT_1319679, partial [Mycena metata]
MAASQSSNNNNNKNNTSLPSSATFSFKAPFLPASATASTSTSTSTSASSSGTDIACAPNAAEGSGQQKQRRVSLALPSSPRLVPAWNFRDDTSVPYADAASAAGRKGKVRRIDTARDEPEGGEEGEEDAEGGKEGVVVKEGGVKEKKVRRKWTPAETQMLVDGCTKHGVGNWKAILSDPALTFAGRSPVDLKDRTSTSTSPDSLAPSSSSATTTSAPLPPPPPNKPNRSTHPDGTPLFPLPSPLHPKRRPFTPEEDSALLAGFRKHGAAWAAIAKEAPVFGVTGRRSMDLRDRFRNAWPGEY